MLNLLCHRSLSLARTRSGTIYPTLNRRLRLGFRSCREFCEPLGSADHLPLKRCAAGIPSLNFKSIVGRAKALKLAWEDEREVGERCARINELLNQAAYTDEDKTEIKVLLGKLGLTDKDDGGRYAVLHQERGRLLRRPEADAVEIIASGRASWIGGVELKSKPVDEWRWEVPFW